MCECVREMTLQEYIVSLKEHNVPDAKIDRMLTLLKERDYEEQCRAEQIEAEVRFTEERNRNLGAVVDALGAYLYRENTIYRE